MDCYDCACNGVEKRAVALCHCNVGLCMNHLENLQAAGGMRYRCNHRLPRPQEIVAT